MDKQAKLKLVINALADRIRERRKALGLTQEKLAERAGLSVNFIAQLEISDKTPSMATLVAIADALETDISDLFASSAQEKWIDEVQNILRSLEDMREPDVRFALSQLQTTINHLKWERDRNDQED